MLLSSREDFPLPLAGQSGAHRRASSWAEVARSARGRGVKLLRPQRSGSALGFLCSAGVTLWDQCKGGGGRGRGARPGPRLCCGVGARL